MCCFVVGCGVFCWHCVMRASIGVLCLLACLLAATGRSAEACTLMYALLYISCRSIHLPASQLAWQSLFGSDSRARAPARSLAHRQIACLAGRFADWKPTGPCCT